MKKLQQVVDFASTIGDLSPVLRAGGYSTEPAMTIASDVMTELLSERFNWKFNRMIVPPFLTNSWQQDYVSAVNNIGWLEHAAAIDINNTSLPKPIYWPECVRDLERISIQSGRPSKVCWLPNDQLVQDVWPGAQKTYTNPLGQVQTPTNPNTNILDANGNILLLTTYGITGNVAPVLAAAAAVGATVNDGTCVWTKVDPKAQGFRLSPIPPQQGNVFQLHIIAQKKPVLFTSLDQTIDPIPDDFAKYFQDGFIAYCHRHSAAPLVRNRFEQMRADWLQSLARARGQGDRERDDAGFVPDKGIMSGGGNIPIGPGWPYGPGIG